MSTSQPIRSAEDIARVRATLRSTRDHCLFTLGINTAFRGSDLLALNVGDVKALSPELVIREKKTGKQRRVTLNAACLDALRGMLEERPDARDTDPLFLGNKGTRLTIVSLSRMWKAWCLQAGLIGGFGSHTGRKTMATAAYRRGVRIEVIQKLLNHSSPAVTMTYIGIQDEDLRAIYSVCL